MSVKQCFVGLCFIPLDPNSSKFFGFAEFLAGLALMVLAWTIADVRYRFRVQTAPIPLQGITFWVVTTVGVLTYKIRNALRQLIIAGSTLTEEINHWYSILCRSNHQGVR